MRRCDPELLPLTLTRSGFFGVSFRGAAASGTEVEEIFVLTETERHGEAAIAEAVLEAVPNPSPGRDYTVDLSYPEFTCKCPRTGYPDFATITLRYVPDRNIVELRSFKLYLNRFRDAYAFHEAVTNQVLDDFVEAIQPRFAEISADWNVRGNLKTVVRAEYRST